MIPEIPMFWLISTALVLQGVIISFLGPIKLPATSVNVSAWAPPNNHSNFISSCSSGYWIKSTAKTEEVLVKKMTIQSVLNWKMGFFQYKYIK
jgi:hypothetical protein